MFGSAGVTSAVENPLFTELRLNYIRHLIKLREYAVDCLVLNYDLTIITPHFKKKPVLALSPHSYLVVLLLFRNNSKRQ